MKILTTTYPRSMSMDVVQTTIGGFGVRGLVIPYYFTIGSVWTLVSPGNGEKASGWVDDVPEWTERSYFDWVQMFYEGRNYFSNTRELALEASRRAIEEIALLPVGVELRIDPDTGLLVGANTEWNAVLEKSRQQIKNTVLASMVDTFLRHDDLSSLERAFES